MSSNDDKVVSLDIQEINLDVPSNPSQETFSIDTTRPSSSSLGDGIELLMNDKVKNSQNNSESNSKSMEEELNDLNDLNELNNMKIAPELTAHVQTNDYKER